MIILGEQAEFASSWQFLTHVLLLLEARGSCSGALASSVLWTHHNSTLRSQDHLREQLGTVPTSLETSCCPCRVERNPSIAKASLMLLLPHHTELEQAGSLEQLPAASEPVCNRELGLDRGRTVYWTFMGSPDIRLSQPGCMESKELPYASHHAL